jgi:hypothetical protein
MEDKAKHWTDAGIASLLTILLQTPISNEGISIMADNKNRATKPVETPLVGGTTPESEKARKPRGPRVKWDKVIPSAYVPAKEGQKLHPLDELAVLQFGGLRFPGVEFETTAFGSGVKIRDKGTVIAQPTYRQLFDILEKLYS